MHYLANVKSSQLTRLVELQVHTSCLNATHIHGSSATKHKNVRHCFK